MRGLELGLSRIGYVGMSSRDECTGSSGTGRYFRPSKAHMLRIFELIFVAHHMKVDDVVHADPEKLPSDWNDAVARSGTPRS